MPGRRSNTLPIMWTQSSGYKTAIRDMGDRHLNAAKAMLEHQLGTDLFVLQVNHALTGFHNISLTTQAEFVSTPHKNQTRADMIVKLNWKYRYILAFDEELKRRNLDHVGNEADQHVSSEADGKLR